MMESFITNQNDLFVYFEVIKQLSPSSVLDVGMLLKRAGAVSRQVADSCLAPELELTGIDFLPECKTPVYDLIYDHILKESDFSRKSNVHYDLVSLIGAFSIPSFLSPAFLREHASWVLISDSINRSAFPSVNGRSIRLEDDLYQLIQIKKVLV